MISLSPARRGYARGHGRGCTRVGVCARATALARVVVPTKHGELQRGVRSGENTGGEQRTRRAEENRSEVTGEIRENGRNNKQGSEAKKSSGQDRNTGYTARGGGRVGGKGTG